MGKYDEKTILKTLLNTTFIIDNQPYIFAKLNSDGLEKAKDIFSSSKSELKVLSVDPWEVTLIIPEKELPKELEAFIIEKQTVNPIYCDTHPDWPTCTGYLLKIAELLSPSNIGIYVFGAYRSDHILVDIKDSKKAMSLLEEMKIKLAQ